MYPFLASGRKKDSQNSAKGLEFRRWKLVQSKELGAGNDLILRTGDEEKIISSVQSNFYSTQMNFDKIKQQISGYINTDKTASP